jgi:hypothetical protein
LVASGFLNPGWGITLLAVGGLSFIFREASMFIMYAVALIWVGISNILSLDWGIWTFLGAYQIYLGAMLFQKFRRYRDYEHQHLNNNKEASSGVNTGRAEKLFPWLGASMAGIGLLVYAAAIVVMFIAVVMVYETPGGSISDSLAVALDLISGVALGIGIIGFGLSLSSVVSKYKQKWLSWAGIVFGSFLILLEILIKIWIIFSS